MSLDSKKNVWPQKHFKSRCGDDGIRTSETIFWLKKNRRGNRLEEEELVNPGERIEVFFLKEGCWNDKKEGKDAGESLEIKVLVKECEDSKQVGMWLTGRQTGWWRMDDHNFSLGRSTCDHEIRNFEQAVGHTW
jgi:hypothetical protein